MTSKADASKAASPAPTYTVFADDERLTTGSLEDVSVAAKRAADEAPTVTVLAFDDDTGLQIDLELQGSIDEVRSRAAAVATFLAQKAADATSGADASPPTPPTASRAKKKGPGRPKLGVVSKEVTLLPRHWAWLSAQRGGASATLRRLVDEARKAGEGHERVRRAQDAAYRFMKAMAGNRAGYEEANRALFRGDADRFETETASWPSHVREYARRLATPALDATATTPSGEERGEA